MVLLKAWRRCFPALRYVFTFMNYVLLACSCWFDEGTLANDVVDRQRKSMSSLSMSWTVPSLILARPLIRRPGRSGTRARRGLRESFGGRDALMRKLYWEG
jgi:hypothetical protein